MGDRGSPKSWPLKSTVLAYRFWLQLVRFLISVICMNKKSQCSVVTTLWAGPSKVQIPLGARDFSLLRKSRQSLVPTHPPVQWVLGSFPGVKQPGNEVNQSPPFRPCMALTWKTLSYVYKWVYVGNIMLNNDNFIFPQYDRSEFITWMIHMRYLQ